LSFWTVVDWFIKEFLIVLVQTVIMIALHLVEVFIPVRIGFLCLSEVSARVAYYSLVVFWRSAS